MDSVDDMFWMFVSVRMANETREPEAKMSWNTVALYSALAQILPPGFAWSLFSLKATLNKIFYLAEMHERSADALLIVEVESEREKGLEEQQHSLPLTQDATVHEVPTTSKKRQSYSNGPSILEKISVLSYFSVTISCQIPPIGPPPFSNPFPMLLIMRLYLIFPLVQVRYRYLLPPPPPNTAENREKQSKERRDDWKMSLMLTGGITACQLFFTLKACKWDVVFVIMKIATTFTRNDVVRTLAMDSLFIAAGLKSYGGFELAKLEKRLRKAIEDREKGKENNDADQVSHAQGRPGQKEVDLTSRNKTFVRILNAISSSRATASA